MKCTPNKMLRRILGVGAVVAKCPARLHAPASKILPIVIVLLSAAGMAQASVDILSDKEFHMPTEWFGCNTSNDCTWIGYDCGGNGFAVSRAHRGDAYQAFCETRQAQGRGCIMACTASLLPNSFAACEAGHCVTKSR